MFVADRVLKRFQSCRTEHIKLWKRVQKAKTGGKGGELHLTASQKFKLDHYKFVRTVHQSRTVQDTLGQVKITTTLLQMKYILFSEYI
jgi:hypothetical protein